MATEYSCMSQEQLLMVVDERDAEIELLRANVHLAFYEGFAAAQRHTDSDFAWDQSEAREALRDD